MTISYQLDVSSASALAFSRLLFRWKGSIWKIVYRELIVWTIVYLIITFFYRTDYFLSKQQKAIFEELARYLDTHLSFIPLTFILGFFVTSIVSRWSDIFNNMGYVESQAIFIGNYVQGADRETRLLRRAMARYMCLTQALVFRDISVKVRQRFPNYDSLVKAGFATEEEKEKLESIKLRYDKYWAPTNWIYTLIFRARREGKISHDILASKLCDEIKYFRYNLQMVCNYDWVPLPLVYPQAVFLAVYVYFGICLISRQFVATDRTEAPNRDRIDIYLPIMSMIQFFFFIGWVKVAQGLLNPFGTDDDDFECNYLLDKNLATSMCIVDDEHGNPPEIQPDKFWHRGRIKPMYTGPAKTAPNHPLVGSAISTKLKNADEPVEMVERNLEPCPDTVSIKRKFSQLSHVVPSISSHLRSRSRIFTTASSLSTDTDTMSKCRTPHLSRFHGKRFMSTIGGPYTNKEENEDTRRKSLMTSIRLFEDSATDTPTNAETAERSSESDFVPPDPSPSMHHRNLHHQSKQS